MQINSGALIVSRTVDDPDLSNEILSAVGSAMHTKSGVQSVETHPRSPALQC